jgi:hypothetical protein
LFAKQFAKSEEKDFGISTRPQPTARCEDVDIDEDMMDDGNCLIILSGIRITFWCLKMI